MNSVFLRVATARDKADALLRALHQLSAEGTRANRFETDASTFARVAGSPFAYWVSDALRELFTVLPTFASATRTAKQGLATGQDARFLRVWWEVVGSSDTQGWRNLVKGGAPALFYSEPASVVNWVVDGRELKAFASFYRSSRGWGDQWSAMINATEYYFRPGFTWPLRHRDSLRPRCPQGARSVPVAAADLLKSGS